MAELLPSGGVDTGNSSDIEFFNSSVDKELLSSKKETARSGPADGRILSFLRSITGQTLMQDSDVEEVLKKMKEHLIHKNVASNIADQLCQAVGKSIKGQRLGTCQQMTALIKDSLEMAIKQILTPNSASDIFVEIAMAKAKNRPYTIAFIGVNGVGKSTNLSKVCYWALKKNFKVLIVACDTFRSGAIEQLKTHVKALSALQQGSVEIFERGYGKDASGIAKEAIQFAKNNGHDVVLIDTAGRMQDNEPLMRALGKLVSENQPDKVVFVGEALVGNEAVDQLAKFNKALLDYSWSNSKAPRQIDGIILTKFDTIDDKVGAALSMSYTANAPILFIGTGQSYGDLKLMNVKSLATTLLNP